MFLFKVEEEAVRRACSLALSANVPLVICAPSSPDVVAVIAEYQARGLIVLGEARGAALAVDGSHYFNQCWSHAAAFVASPPLREGENVPEELVNALKVSISISITNIITKFMIRMGKVWTLWAAVTLGSRKHRELLLVRITSLLFLRFLIVVMVRRRTMMTMMMMTIMLMMMITMMTMT